MLILSIHSKLLAYLSSKAYYQLFSLSSEQNPFLLFLNCKERRTKKRMVKIPLQEIMLGYMANLQ